MTRLRLILFSGVIFLIACVGVILLIPVTRHMVVSQVHFIMARPDHDALKRDGTLIAEELWRIRERSGSFPAEFDRMGLALEASLLDNWIISLGDSVFSLVIYTGKGREILVGEWRSPTDFEWIIVPHE